MKWFERVVSLCGGLLLIYPGIITELIGLGLVAVVVGIQLVTKNSSVIF